MRVTEYRPTSWEARKKENETSEKKKTKQKPGGGGTNRANLRRGLAGGGIRVTGNEGEGEPERCRTA